MAEDLFGIVGTTQAGAYQVEAVVAEGGFAVVYRAYHAAFRSPVALKCLKIPGTLPGAAQAQFLEHFREEAELLFRLSASIPTVVRPLHVGTLETTTGVFAPFIALEWLDGRTLDSVIDQRRADGLQPLTLKRAVKMLAPVAAALDRAHHFPSSSGEITILHRDLKPENIFIADVNGTEVVKIVDFGIGKVKTAATQIVGRQSSTTPGISAFTPAYGAPEQWLPKRFGQTGSWTDVWGLALTVVEMVIGRPPLEGDSGALMGAAIDEARRPTPRTEGVATSSEVETVFKRALAVDPANRYHEVAEFWHDLEEALSVPFSEVSRSMSSDPRAEGRSGARVDVTVALPKSNTEFMQTDRPPAWPAAPSSAPKPAASAAGPGAAPKPGAPPVQIKVNTPGPASASPGRESMTQAAPTQAIPDLVLDTGPTPSAGAGAPIGGAAAVSKPSSPRLKITVAQVDPGASPNAGVQSPMFGGVMLEDPDEPEPPSAPPAPKQSKSSVSGQMPAVGLSREPASARMPPRTVRAPTAAVTALVRPTTQLSLGEKLKGPATLVITGIVLMAADFAYANATGASFQIGPVRTLFVAAPLVVLGIAMGVYRLAGDD